MNTPDPESLKQRTTRRAFCRSLIRSGLGLSLGLGLGGGGLLAGSDFFRLRLTLPGDPRLRRPVRFTVLADTHYADLDDTDRPRFFRSSLGNMRAVAEDLAAEGGDFLVHLGDVIQERGSFGPTSAALAEADAALAAFSGPRHYVLGNHDAVDFTKNEFLGLTAGAARATQYHFDEAGFRFIVLDTCFRSDGVAYRRGNFNWTDTYLPPRNLAWLERTLARARVDGLPCVVFAHQNVVGDDARFILSNAAEVRSVLESAGNVVLVLQGHRHANYFFAAGGVQYVTLPATVNAADSAGMLVEIDDETGIRLTGLTPRQPDYLFPAPPL